MYGVVLRRCGRDGARGGAVCVCGREAKGFAFIEFLDSRDARDAKEDLDRSMLDGRELQVVFAQVTMPCSQLVARSLRCDGRDEGGGRVVGWAASLARSRVEEGAPWLTSVPMCGYRVLLCRTGAAQDA